MSKHCAECEPDPGDDDYEYSKDLQEDAEDTLDELMEEVAEVYWCPRLLAAYACTKQYGQPLQSQVL